MINLRHHGVAPITKFLVGKRGVDADDGERRMGEKFVRPVGAHLRAKLPRLRRAIGDPRAAGFPLRLGVKNKTVRALVKNIIRHCDFADEVRAVGTVVAKDQNAVRVREADEVAGELAAGGAVAKQFVARGGFDEAVAQPGGFVIRHQAVDVRHARNVAAELVGRVFHRINPHAFAEVRRVNAAVTDRRGVEHQASANPRQQE